jgi:NodT family efflux transporter outer membrane factor (OMF) lipoprotein
VADRWLASFDDPALTALVAEALLYNADLQVAAARVEQAAGYVKVASGSLLPSVGVFAMGGGKSGGSGGLDGVWLNASLELDVWGRLRYGSAAAEAQSAAVTADYAYARQSLAATVAKAWFVAIEAGLQRAIAQDVLRSSESLFKVAQDRLRIGNGNEQAVAEAGATVGTYRDTLRQIELARGQALRALELLLGRYPAAEIAVAERLSAMPPPLPVGMPSQLLERRPDVIAAERRVAVAFDRVGEARAAQLPRISLTAGGSSVSSDLIVLKDVNNPIWSFGANLIAPLYQGGALQAQVEIRSAEQKQAVAEYARTGQRAFGEVENALAAESTLRDRDAILEATVRDSARALELSKIQYRVGTVDLRAVEQSQLSLYVARMSLLRVQTDRRAQRVNLYLALGGGFDQPAMEPLAAQ